eukprot:TRINITY_DN3487_c0_g1_i1.p1 TRINITY_DN3487_c0_g1~~TRINITY_DN3487_c0_g1_i1.p1  ORF type:complete len:1695 (-),score=489.23 TRINITY_DN3487_c0_g1_i1:24-4382(-)
MARLNDDCIWSGSEDATICVWNGGGSLLHKLSNHHISGIQSLLPVGLHMWSAGDKTVRIWDISSNTVMKTLEYGGWVYTLASADDFVWVSTSDKSVSIYHVDDPIKARMKASAAVESPDVSSEPMVSRTRAGALAETAQQRTRTTAVSDVVEGSVQRVRAGVTTDTTPEIDDMRRQIEIQQEQLRAERERLKREMSNIPDPVVVRFSITRCVECDSNRQRLLTAEQRVTSLTATQSELQNIVEQTQLQLEEQDDMLVAERKQTRQLTDALNKSRQEVDKLQRDLTFARENAMTAGAAVEQLQSLQRNPGSDQTAEIIKLRRELDVANVALSEARTTQPAGSQPAAGTATQQQQERLIASLKQAMEDQHEALMHNQQVIAELRSEKENMVVEMASRSRSGTWTDDGAAQQDSGEFRAMHDKQKHQLQELQDALAKERSKVNVLTERQQAAQSQYDRQNAEMQRSQMLHDRVSEDLRRERQTNDDLRSRYDNLMSQRLAEKSEAQAQASAFAAQLQQAQSQTAEFAKQLRDMMDRSRAVAATSDDATYLRLQLEGQQQTVKQLQEQLDEQRTAHAQAMGKRQYEVKTALEKAELANIQLEAERSAHAKLQDEYAAQQQLLQSLKDQLEKNRLRAESLQAQLAGDPSAQQGREQEMLAQIQQLQADLLTTQSATRDAQRQFSQRAAGTSSSMQEMQQQLDAALAEKAEMQETMDAVSSAANAGRQRSQQQAQQILQLQQDLTREQSAARDLRDQLAASSGDQVVIVQQLQAEKLQLIATRDNLEGQLVTLGADLDKASTSLQKLKIDFQQQLETERSDREAAQKELKAVTALKDQLQARLESLSGSLNQPSDAIVKQADTLRAQLRVEETNNLALRKQCADLQLQIVQLERSDGKSLSFNAERTQMQKRIADLEAELGRLRALLAQQQAQPSTREAAPKPVKAPSVVSFDKARSSFGTECVKVFITFTNRLCVGDRDLRDKLPIRDANDFLQKSLDGILFCKLVNKLFPGALDERVIAIPAQTAKAVQANVNLAINTALAVGCEVEHVSVHEVTQANVDKMLELVWQMIRWQALCHITAANYSGLNTLLGSDESLDALRTLPREVLVQRWVNAQLSVARCNRTLNNFSSDLQDGVIHRALLVSALQVDAPSPASSAAEIARAVAEKSGVCSECITAQAILDGDERLNMWYFATMLGACGIAGSTASDASAGSADGDDDHITREERNLRVWLNRSGIDVEVQSLFSDLSDGIVLLKALERLAPASVLWQKVNIPPRNLFMRVENCEMAIAVGKKLGMHLDISGKAIETCHQKSLLSFVWQMMQYYSLSTLRAQAGGGDVKEEDLVTWANNKVRAAGKTTRIDSFRDKSLRTGLFLIDLVAALEPRAVNEAMVVRAESDEASTKNARYLASVARQLPISAASGMLLWQDIKMVRHKSVLAFIGGLALTYGDSRSRKE